MLAAAITLHKATVRYRGIRAAPLSAAISAGDYKTWRTHFGETAGSGAELPAAPVPEPASSMLALPLLSLAATRSGALLRAAR